MIEVGEFLIHGLVFIPRADPGDCEYQHGQSKEDRYPHSVVDAHINVLLSMLYVLEAERARIHIDYFINYN